MCIVSPQATTVSIVYLPLFHVRRTSHVIVFQTGGMIGAVKYLVDWEEAFIYVILRETIPHGERQRSRQRQRICLVSKPFSRGKGPRLYNIVLCMQRLGPCVLIQQPSPPPALLCVSSSTGKREETGFEVRGERGVGVLSTEHYEMPIQPDELDKREYDKFPAQNIVWTPFPDALIHIRTQAFQHARHVFALSTCTHFFQPCHACSTKSWGTHAMAE